jgi:hypothetical protein
MPSDWLGWALFAVCLVLTLLPPKWDPAIRLKEWAYRKPCEPCQGSGRVGGHICGQCEGKGKVPW